MNGCINKMTISSNIPLSVKSIRCKLSYHNRDGCGAYGTVHLTDISLFSIFRFVSLFRKKDTQNIIIWIYDIHLDQWQWTNTVPHSRFSISFLQNILLFLFSFSFNFEKYWKTSRIRTQYLYRTIGHILPHNDLNRYRLQI